MVELVAKRPHVCNALGRALEDQAQASSSADKGAGDSKIKKYDFDILKADQIFVHLLVDGVIKPGFGHKIPQAIEVKNKTYC